VIQEGARRAFHIFDEPTSSRAPEFAVTPTDDLRLEADWGGRWGVAGCIGGVVSFRISANFDNLFPGR